jgi:hypothetical protein
VTDPQLSEAVALDGLQRGTDPRSGTDMSAGHAIVGGVSSMTVCVRMHCEEFPQSSVAV